jgi:hypothetical protein
MISFRGLCLLGAASAFAACSVKSLPPGTPPPEYERRSFEPWPATDAGPDADALATPDASSPDALATPVASSPDASSVDAAPELPDASVR